MCLNVAAPKAGPGEMMWLCDTGRFVSCDAVAK